MREITQTRIHYGCERVLVMLRREGWRDNHKRVHRIYKEEGLSLRHCRPRRSRSSRRRQPIKIATAPNTLWGMDFVSDALFDGRRIRLLPVLDHLTPECLEIVVDQSLRADDVAEAVTRLVVQRGKPDAIKVDNGSEFAGKVLDRWTTSSPNRLRSNLIEALSIAPSPSRPLRHCGLCTRWRAIVLLTSHVWEQNAKRPPFRPTEH